MATSNVPSRAPLATRWASPLLSWYESFQRDLPWRREPQPYHTWICEVMSQQTTMAVVVPRFVTFVEALPSVQALAAASDDVLRSLWAGLGYYARARNLRKGAEYIAHERQGRFPSGYAEWLEVPGVGPYTAAVIASINDGDPVACVDGNVIRVASRLRALSQVPDVWSGEGQRRIRDFVQAELDASSEARARPGHFNQAMMELGATVCTKNSPSCLHCPIQRSCAALAQGVVSMCPPTKPRKDIAEVSLLALCLTGEKGVLLVEREVGFLKGTRGLPLVDSRFFPDLVAHASLEAALGVPLVRAGAFSHGITNHSIEGEAVIARIGDAPLPDLRFGSFRWTPIREVASALSSSLDRKAWDRARAMFESLD